MTKRQKLTKTMCDTAPEVAPVDGKPREIVLWDGGVSGFGLKVTSGGARSFILMYRAGEGDARKLRKLTIGPYGSPWTVETARKEAKRVLGLVAAGQDPAGAKAEKRAVQKAGAPVADPLDQVDHVALADGRQVAISPRRKDVALHHTAHFRDRA